MISRYCLIFLKLFIITATKIRDRIKTWNTKEKVINIMRYRYVQLDDEIA